MEAHLDDILDVVANTLNVKVQDVPSIFIENNNHQNDHAYDLIRSTR